MRAIRGGRISIIFQEPMTSLSPLHTIGNQVGEALRLHRDGNRRAGDRADRGNAAACRLPRSEAGVASYPFELSGGLRQRAMIAMALVCRPALLIADEPTTALDVTIQAQILKLMIELQHELGMAVLLITHDLGVVANVAEEIVVMYRGEVMESGTLDDIFRAAEHPYLKALLRAVPRFDMKPGERLVPLREIPPGDAPHLMAEKRKWPADAVGPLLECVDVKRPIALRKSGLVRQRQTGARDGRSRRHQPEDRAGRVPRPGRRERLRQDHPSAKCCCGRSCRIRDRSPSTTTARLIDLLSLDGEDLKLVPAAGPVHLSGSVRLS